MTEQHYETMTRPFRENPDAALWLVRIDKALTVLGYVAYPLLLAVVAAGGLWATLARFVVVPAAGFIALSAFRSFYDAPRPYEALSIDPLIRKDTVGRSFPSRHAFSLMMISCSWFAYSMPVGIVLIVCSFMLACVRVIGGVHFPRDVVAGALFAVFCALIGYVLLP